MKPSAPQLTAAARARARSSVVVRRRDGMRFRQAAFVLSLACAFLTGGIILEIYWIAPAFAEGNGNGNGGGNGNGNGNGGGNGNGQSGGNGNGNEGGEGGDGSGGGEGGEGSGGGEGGEGSGGGESGEGSGGGESGEGSGGEGEGASGGSGEEDGGSGSGDDSADGGESSGGSSEGSGESSESADGDGEDGSGEDVESSVSIGSGSARPPAAKPVETEIEDPDSALNLHESGRIRSLGDVFSAAERQLDGKVIDAKLVGSREGWSYDVRVVTRDGHVREARYDAKTLDLRSVNGEPVE
jgi:hypothetical protein